MAKVNKSILPEIRLKNNPAPADRRGWLFNRILCGYSDINAGYSPTLIGVDVVVEPKPVT